MTSVMSALFGNKVIRVRDQWAEYKCGAIIPPAPDNGPQLVSIAPNLSKHSILTTQAAISWDLSRDWELGDIDSICWAVKQVIGYTTSSKCRSVTSCEMNDVWRCLCCDMQWSQHGDYHAPCHQMTASHWSDVSDAGLWLVNIVWS